MIAANVAAARFLDRHRVPTLYRVHGLPELDRLETLRSSCASSASGCRPPDEITPEHLRDLLQKIGDRPDAGLIATAVIRSMPQAVYQPGNIGHFGLALEHYAHFTSPIRRYPDLVVHRGIRQVLRAGDPQELIAWHGPFPIARAGLFVPRASRGRGDAQRRRVAQVLLHAAIASARSSTASSRAWSTSGCSCSSRACRSTACCTCRRSGPDYFARDSSGFRMVGRSSGQVFKLGDRLRVRVTNVSLDERRIDFELAGEFEPARRSTPRFQRQGQRRRRG